MNWNPHTSNISLCSLGVRRAQDARAAAAVLSKSTSAAQQAEHPAIPSSTSRCSPVLAREKKGRRLILKICHGRRWEAAGGSRRSSGRSEAGISRRGRAQTGCRMTPIAPELAAVVRGCFDADTDWAVMSPFQSVALSSAHNCCSMVQWRHGS